LVLLLLPALAAGDAGVLVETGATGAVAETLEILIGKFLLVPQTLRPHPPITTESNR
jgi:hypothetical protein